MTQIAVTEAEALEKWCPFARVYHTQGGAFNRMRGRSATEDGTASCIGSKCMAWRDVGEAPDAQREGEREFNRTGRRLPVARVGVCGLVGG